MKKIITILIVVFAVFAFLKLASKPPSNSLNSDENVDFIFYYGDGCPHCVTVEEYMETKKVEDKLVISQKEVYYDQKNSKEFQENISQYCPEIMSDQGIGVPVAFDVKNKKCYLGSPPIIDFIDQLLAELSEKELPI